MDIELKKIEVSSAIDVLRDSIPEEYATRKDIEWLWGNVESFLDKANALWKEDDYSDADLTGQIKDEFSEMLDKIIDLKVKKAEIENKQEKTRDELEVEKRNFMQKFWKKIMLKKFLFILFCSLCSFFLSGSFSKLPEMVYYL